LLLLPVLTVILIMIYQYSRSKTIPQTADSGVLTAEALLSSLSRNEFAGTEKQVASKLRAMIEEVNENPGSAYAWGKLAMNLDVHDLPGEATLCYQKAGELNVSDYRWPYYRALILYKQGSAEALKYFEQSLALKQNHPAARLGYGQALLDAGRLEEASDQYLKALQIDERSAHAYVGLARIALMNGVVEEAGSLLQRAINANPRMGEAHGLMSEVLRRLNRPQDAAREAMVSQQLPKVTPIPDELLAALAGEGVSSYWLELRGRAAMERGDYAGAERELRKAADATKDPRLHDTLGVVYLYQRKYSDAAQEHRKAIELNPKSAISRNNLAAALFEMGQESEALSIIEKAIEMEPQLQYSYLHLARLNIRSGKRAAAISVYRKGLEQNPQNHDLTMQLAWALATTPDASLRNGPDAVRLAETAALRSPGAEALDILAAAYAEAGQFDRAVGAAERAIAQAESNGRKQLVERIRIHLKAFKAGRAYHE